MTLRSSKKLFWPLLVFFILSFCPPMLSDSFACGSTRAEGISFLEVCAKDFPSLLLEEPGIAEDGHSVLCFAPITTLQNQEGSSILTLAPPLPDKPPAT
jgi:hypothetical protein